MIELRDDALEFKFAEVHKDATLRIGFQRTLRIPDDGATYHLPPGLGHFPLAHVDDHADRVPASWLDHGGVILPMYQSEAMWIHFWGTYPCAVKIAAGMINAVTGEPWRTGLHRGPQDYVVTDSQPWLDGFCVEKGIIRQFVAAPLGSGHTAEEQLTGVAAHGGLQVAVIPLRAEAYARYLEKRISDESRYVLYCKSRTEMGLGAGGRMRQEIYTDTFKLEDWDTAHACRCFVHIANSLAWKRLTGLVAPPTPITAKAYSQHGLPWFDYYASDQIALPGSATLAGLQSVGALSMAKGNPLADNEPIVPPQVITLSKHTAPRFVRETGA